MGKPYSASCVVAAAAQICDLLETTTLLKITEKVERKKSEQTR